VRAREYNSSAISPTTTVIAAKEKLEIVKSCGEAAPNSQGVPRRRRRRNAFGLIQEYCIIHIGSPARLWREPYFSAKGGSASG